MSGFSRLSRVLPALGLLLAVGALSGCASQPPADDPDAVAEYRETNDPIEPTNRVVYAINDAFDKAIFRPLAVGYRAVLPQTVRDHTHNFLGNFGMPVQMVNDILQTKPRHAGDSMMRFVTNTTLGIGGIFDVATDFGWPNHDADAGMTLALWGVPTGPYVYLPLFGPSSPREGVGLGMDYMMDPFNWIGVDATDRDLGYGKTGVSALDERSRVIDDLDKVTGQALDPYATIRSLYRQHRQSQIEDARDDSKPTIPAWFPAAIPAPSKSGSVGSTQK